MYEAGRPNPSAFNVLLDMLCGMATRGEILVSAIRAFLKTDINILVNAFRPLPEVSRMAEWRSFLLRVFRNFLHFIFIERCLQCAHQLFLNIFFFRLKFRISFAKFYDLRGCKVHSSFKRVHPCPEIVSFDKDFFRRLPVKIQTGLVERAIEVQLFFTGRIKPPLFHDSRPELFAIMHRPQVNRHPANLVAGCYGVANLFYQKTTTMSIGMFG
jgi:hypothetical protein